LRSDEGQGLEALRLRIPGEKGTDKEGRETIG